ncbi:hypothetical protein CW751_09145 [Brumimicrobium salinarum]|uniref:M23ase beta-sheet core domain-containing protein n=1 Tax=Brumimicrobium salinarum TaxID=2058658 RepID=A0A2I0R2B1_9FLAO|nr:M23 family metallopeptidase [Brumimicrobium salinarum]PKR80530.1 hypothetical protein CW751_09145 [Brumimicrobium salinarum]
MRSFFILFVSYFLSVFCYSQKKEIDYGDYDLHSPLDVPLILAANFGELRTNHFHTGIDLKTDRRTGYNILSIADGYVSRIKVSPWGYGHAVYIDHYNGLTSVYAHCESFVGKIGEVTLSQQEKNNSFAIDYYPEKDAIQVKKGQLIAKSGNTGGSTAPHLHFEIRETKTEHALNPLLFNFDIQDTRKPNIRYLKVYALTEEGYRVPNKSKRFRLWGKDGQFYVKNNSVNIDASYTSEHGGIGFSFDAIDQLNGANNICGIHEAILEVNNDTIYTQNMEYIDFYTNRHINTHKDYEEFHNRRRHFQKTFITEHNALPIYRQLKNKGIIKASPGKSYIINYTAKDAYANTSQINFTLNVGTGKKKKQQTLYLEEKLLYPDSAFLSYDKNHYLLFPPGIIYEPTPLKLKSEPNNIEFGSDLIPLQETFKLMLPIIPNQQENKQYIQRISRYGTQYSEGGSVKNGWITSRIKSFGTFSVEIDTIAPQIRARNFINNGTVRGKRLSWSIDEHESGLKSYNISIDNNWYLLSYEPKRSMFYFDPPKELKGNKQVTIKATDACGNENTESYQLTF